MGMGGSFQDYSRIQDLEADFSIESQPQNTEFGIETCTCAGLSESSLYAYEQNQICFDHIIFAQISTVFTAYLLALLIHIFSSKISYSLGPKIKSCLSFSSTELFYLPPQRLF